MLIKKEFLHLFTEKICEGKVQLTQLSGIKYMESLRPRTEWKKERKAHLNLQTKAFISLCCLYS